MSSRFMGSLLLTLMFALGASSAIAQMPNPYGAPIGLENAKKAAVAAVAEASKNHWEGKGGHPIFPLSREKVAVWKCSDFNELQDESPWGHTSPLGP